MPYYGICIRHKASRGYATGNKHCHHCNLFIKRNWLLCLCCGYKLRTRPKVSKYKEKLREQKLMAQAEEVKILYHTLTHPW